MVAKNKVFGDYTPNWSSTAISGTADSFKLSGLHSVTAGEDISGNYSNEITVKIQHQNIEGSSFDIMKNGSGDDYKFIFDPETYSILDSSGGSRDLDDVVVSAVSINTASNDSGFDSNHLMSLTILNGPDIFDPSNATTMINQVNDWTYDKIDVTKDVQNSNRMVLYKGKFLTPASLESEFTGITTSYYHNNLTSTLTNYSKVISNNDFVIPSNKDVFKDNYKWQFYKYKWNRSRLFS